eukprot:jgi/Psemu1/304213/fgenesh1_kg.139_\
MKTTLILFLKGDPRAHTNSEQYNTRGLESLTPKATKSKKRRRYESMKAVFDEQYRQFRLAKCINNPERLSQLYMDATKLSKKRARLTGIVYAKSESQNTVFLIFFGSTKQDQKR